MAARVQTWLMLLVPALALLALEGRGLDYAFVWTDHGEIEQGTLIRPRGEWLAAFAQPLHANLDLRLARMPQSYYRPLHVVLASAIAAGPGRVPRHFRLVAYALGAATAALFAGFAWLLLGRRGAALWAGLIVAVHPAGIEVYTWVAGLSAALAAFFLLASLLFALLALRSGRAAARAGWGGLSLLALLCGLLSKESAAVGPPLLLALVASDCARRGAPGAGARAWLGALWQANRAALVLVAAQGLLVAFHMLVWRPHVLGAFAVGPPLMGGSLASHLASAIALWPRSLAWLLLPLHSSTSDVVPIVPGWLDARVALGISLALGSLAAWWLLLRRGRVVAAFGLAWVWIAYLPTSGVVPLLHARAERNLFLAVFGVALVASSLGAALRTTWPRLPRRLPALLAALLVLALAQRTWLRLPDWRTSLTLFERDVERDPHYREGRFQLAAALHASGRSAEARPHLETLIAQRGERARFASEVLEPAVYELACHVNERLGLHRDSARLVEEELANQATPEATPGLFFCYAVALESLGRCEDSLDVYFRLAKLDPEQRAITVSIARCYARLGRLDESRRWLDRIPRQTVQDRTLERAIVEVSRMLRAARADAGPR